MENRKPILVLDFDGVCSQYKEWIAIDVIPDPPVPGLFDFLIQAVCEFNVQIFSSRSANPRGITAMRDWFDKHWTEWHKTCGIRDFELPCEHILGMLTFPTEKPPALVTIDDRALTFKGDWQAFDVADLRNFKPWNRQ